MPFHSKTKCGWFSRWSIERMGCFFTSKPFDIEKNLLIYSYFKLFFLYSLESFLFEFIVILISFRWLDVLKREFGVRWYINAYCWLVITNIRKHQLDMKTGKPGFKTIYTINKIHLFCKHGDKRRMYMWVF